MPAVIRVSLKTSPTGVPVPPVTDGVSRNDLRRGYEVTCESVHAATTYSWALAFAPETSGPPAASGDDYLRVDSTATLSSTTTAQTKFVVDNEGSYLIRLVTDVGLGTEDVQFVRLRVMTQFAELFLMAAGERRDESGVIPVDVSAQGWANEQNSNIQRLMLLARRVSSSGRILYVDSNRGRRYSDTSVEPNDPTNIIRMPGPDSARRDETGMRMACEGFADFSSINSAIAYALACVARGEEPLSADDPYVIKIAPGYYTEDITFVPHVHLMADAPGEVVPSEPAVGMMSSTTISTTSNPGAHHQFVATSPGDFVVIRGIFFRNSTSSTEPLLHQSGGLMLFDHCDLLQEGSDPSQGPALLMSEVGGDHPGVFLKDTFVYMQQGNPAFYAIIFEDGGGLLGQDSNIWGDSAVLFNSNFENYAEGSVKFERCTVRAMTADGYAFRGLPGSFDSLDSQYDNEDTTVNPTVAFELVDRAGVLALAGAVTYDANVYLSNSVVEHDTLFRTNQTSGDTNFYPSSLRLGGAFQFPTGGPTLWIPETNSYTLHYDNAYTDPVSPVTPPTVLPTNHVQNAIDMLVGAALPNPTPPYYSLNTAYDGLMSLQPIVYGDGDGRVITADAGAVKIGGAKYPVEDWLTDRVLTGGLQAEGNVDIGPLVDGGSPNGALDNLGSEINLRPGTFAGVAMMSMGRSVVPVGFSSDHRGFPGGIIMGGNPNTMNATGGHVPYNLHLRTRNNYESDTNELGRIVLGGGESYPNFGSIGSGSDTLGGSVYLQGGTCYQPSGVAPYSELGGFIFLAPGMTVDASSVGAGTTPSRVRICLLDDTVTMATLTAGGVFVGGTAGIFYLSGVNGVEQFSVSVTDTINDVINTINQSSYQFLAQDAGGGILEIQSLTPGPNGDVLFVASNPAALNTALGELRVGSGATFTPGAYNKYIDIACTDTDELTVYGDLVVTGTITGGGAVLDYQRFILAVPGPIPLLINDTARLVGVLNILPFFAGHIVTLPLNPPNGRELTIKDESSSAGPFPVLIQTADGSTIDLAPGVPGIPLAVNLQAIRLYYTTSAPIPGWYIA